MQAASFIRLFSLAAIWGSSFLFMRIAVGTLAIGPAGATNAAIMAAQILGLTRPEIAKNVADFRAAQTDKVASKNIPGQV